MTALMRALLSVPGVADADSDTIKDLVVFSALGLFASLLLVLYGTDLGLGF